MKKLALLCLVPLFILSCTCETYVLIKRNYPKEIPTIIFETDGKKLPSKDDEEYKDYATIKIKAKLKGDESYGFEFEEAKARIRGTSSRYFDKKRIQIKI